MDAESNKEVGIVIDRVPSFRCSHCGLELNVADMEPFSPVTCPGCGNVDTVPARFGPFLLLNLISTGGMGGVYQAKDESLGRLVAIKVMLKSLGEDRDFIERFKREAQAAAQLNHPNVAQIHSFGEEKGQPYIVMELVSGQRFDRMIESGKTLDQLMVLRIAIDIAEGLKAADEIGLIHGDIKPENILLDDRRQAKLVDFGIANFRGEGEEGVWGTPYYIAPEKIRRQRSDARSDIYSLGATLYHALAGIPPFDGETPIEVVRARLERAPQPLHTVRDDIHKAVENTISRMLDTEPSRRYPTYASLIGDLRRAVEELEAEQGSKVTQMGRTKRVVLKKKPAIHVIGGQAGGTASGRVSIRGGGASHMASAKQLLQESEAEEQAAKAERRKNARIALTVTTVVVLLGGLIGVGLYVREKRAREVAKRRMVYLLNQEKQKVPEALARVETVATNAVTRALQADTLVQQASGAVSAVMGSLMPVDAMEETDEEEAPGEDVAEAPEPVATPSGPVLDEFGREAPIGLTPHRPRAGAPGPAATAPDDSVPVKTTRPAKKDEPEIVGKLHQAEKEAEEIRTLAAAVRERAKGVYPIYDSAMQASEIPEVANKIGEMEAIITAIDVLAREIDERLRTLEELVTSVMSVKKEMEDREKARRAEEERLRAEAERQAKIEAELRQVEKMQSEIAELVSQFDFDGMAEVLSEVKEGLESKDALQRIALSEDRVTRLVDLWRFLITRLNEDRFRWGWDRGRGVREDVLGADKKGIKLRGRAVTWDKVGTARIIEFVEHYLEKRGVRPSTRGKYYLALAVFCAEQGGDAVARQYVTKALGAAPYLDDEAEGLFPRE